MNKKKMVTILGSTGSIGTQALDVVRKMGYGVVALAAGNNVTLLEEQCREFMPRVAFINDKKGYETLKERLSDTSISVVTGEEALLEIDDLYVLAPYRRLGIGTELFRRCIAESERLGKPLMLYVFTKNTPAVRLYEKMGFVLKETVSPTRSILVRPL